MVCLHELWSGILRATRESAFGLLLSTQDGRRTKTRIKEKEKRVKPITLLSSSPPSIININSHRNPSPGGPRTPPPPLKIKSNRLSPSLLSLLLGLLGLLLSLLASLLGLLLGFLASFFGLAFDFLATLARFSVLVFAVLASLVVAVFGVLFGFFGFLAGVVDVFLRGVAGGLVARAGVVGDEG